MQHEVRRLVPTIKHQPWLLLAVAGRAVLHQNEGVVAVRSMAHVEGHLMRPHRNLAPASDDLQLDRNESPVPEREQRIRNALIDPGLNPGKQAVG